MNRIEALKKLVASTFASFGAPRESEGVLVWEEGKQYLCADYGDGGPVELTAFDDDRARWGEQLWQPGDELNQSIMWTLKE